MLRWTGEERAMPGGSSPGHGARPGSTDPVVRVGCARAREAAKICELVEGAGAQIAFTSGRQWEQPEWPEVRFVIQGDAGTLELLEEDPDLRPYLWDL